MKKPFFLRRHPFLSARDLVSRAIIITLGFAIAHLLGFREQTSFLSGTLSSNQMPSFLSLFMGLSYIVLFLAFTVLAPILIMGALILRSLSTALHRQPKE